MLSDKKVSAKLQGEIIQDIGKFNFDKNGISNNFRSQIVPFGFNLSPKKKPAGQLITKAMKETQNLAQKMNQTMAQGIYQNFIKMTTRKTS